MRRVIVLLLLGIGCGENRAQFQLPIITERRFDSLASVTASRSLGEDCSANGRKDCLSNVCIQRGAIRGKGYICSRACTAQADCAAGWACSQVFPSKHGFLCVPSSALDGGGL